MSIPQANISKPAARQGIQKVELTRCMSIPQANVSKPLARQGIQKVELTSCHVNPPGERQQAGSAARDPEGGTHRLPPRRTSASLQRGKGSRRWNSLAVMSIPQANVNKPPARQGIQKVELTRCHVNPPGECQQAGSAARDPESGTHTLSCQSPRRMSASRQRGKGSRRWNSQAVMSIPRRMSASRQRGKGSRRWNSRAVISIPQTKVSEAAARQGIQKVELTLCHFNPPGERQQAGGSARDPEGGTHALPCQAAKRTLAGHDRVGDLEVETHMLLGGATRRMSASRHGEGSGRELTYCQIKPQGEYQQAGSGVVHPEVRTCILSDQAAKRRLASQKCLKSRKWQLTHCH